MLTTIPDRTGHEVLKRTGRRARAVGIVAAVLVHVALFAFVPAFAITGNVRMTLRIAEWAGPVSPAESFTGFRPIQEASAPPVLVNGPLVLHRVPKVYPPTLWKHREPSAARLELRIDSRGRVVHATLVDGGDGAGELSLLNLAKLMRFKLDGVATGPKGLIATVQVGVLASHYRTPD